MNIDADTALQKWQQELSSMTTRALLAELQLDAAKSQIDELVEELAAVRREGPDALGPPTES